MLCPPLADDSANRESLKRRGENDDSMRNQSDKTNRATKVRKMEGDFMASRRSATGKS